MKNFSFCNPVKIIFGKDSISKLGKQIPANSKIMLVYGGGSIKKNGVYNQVCNAISDFEMIEFSGIEANPHYETCLKCVEKIKVENVNFVLAVGGGSVIDATKFIVAAAKYDGDPWEFVLDERKVKEALPFGTVLTLPATGSEMNAGSVITKAETQEKMAFHNIAVFPQFSILDPETTYSLPQKQIANGIADAFVHVIEQYLTTNEDTKIQDYFAEGILKTLIEESKRVFDDLQNYNCRANIMWASTWGLNGWIAQGCIEDWATHMIGHELTALHGIDHGQTLAIVLPGVMQVMRNEKHDKIIQLGKNVFNISEIDNEIAIDKTIVAVEKFFESLGISTRLSAYGVNDDSIEKIAQRFADRNWLLGEHQNINADIVRKILYLRK